MSWQSPISPERLISSRDFKLAITGGISPDIMFSDILKYPSWFLKLSGIGPFRLFLLAVKCTRFPPTQMFGGSFPVKLLEEKLAFFSDLGPNSSGILPVKLLFARLRISKFSLQCVVVHGKNLQAFHVTYFSRKHSTELVAVEGHAFKHS
ncbi:hypothetical protein C5167_048557 [Papaver somniferum]|uniref:Uncharacterized protein n=1 Tax=Papaver somniferum TaxID=3469 RepID=A0A4Y7KMH5_PAPSO|nr:hypothetical protein C5167_048557 [Papaver somniferum]